MNTHNNVYGDLKAEGYSADLPQPANGSWAPQIWTKNIAVGPRQLDQIKITAKAMTLVTAPGTDFSMDCMDFCITISTRSGFHQETKFVVPADNITYKYLVGVHEQALELFKFASTLTK